MKNQKHHVAGRRPALFSAIALMLLAATASAQFIQQKSWFLQDQYIDFTTPTPTVVSGLPGWTAQPGGKVSNGVHNANGELLFYVNNNEVRNRFGNLIGNLAHIGSSEILTDEINIVPVPGSSCRFYIIYTPSRPGFSATCPDRYYDVHWSEVDMTLNGGNGGFVSNGNNTGACDINGWNSMAVGKLRPGNIRYLYRLGMEPYFGLGYLQRFTISASGISGFTNFGIFGFSMITMTELELSHDETMLAFTGGNSSQVVIFHLDANGNLDATAGNQGNGTSFYYVSASSESMTGVEFSPNSQFLYAAQSNVGI